MISDSLRGNGKSAAKCVVAQRGRLIPVVEPGKPPILEVTSRCPVPDWISAHIYDLDALLLGFGAVLIRGLGVTDPAVLAEVRDRMSPVAVTDTEPFARRLEHGRGVVSSAEWPADQPMNPHHELSYALTFPRLLLYACLSAPLSGGATTLADATTMMSRLPADIVAKFEKLGWIMTRHYEGDVGLPWQEAFGTEDRSDVENYCRDNRIAFEWRPSGGLRTRQGRSAVIRHPSTGQSCWFNQIAFLSRWSMDEEFREYLADVPTADLPFDTRFGDGTPIGADAVRGINEAYETVVLREPWQRGDLLIVDNVRMAHGRDAYVGDRTVALAMADPVGLADCEPSVDPFLPL
ncbi:alpha-ketoglutarate-dependent taurine dioxygenase [Saccharothrix ecbatanensis]|uniref:Alpha-ketoglutarate-dependent taurine dioxygenase n=1 Tax=Saccharothrix ecbatanensis TaxID=1105145 RepID=A0A7W9M161_9PSEU|nr:TauD/TfdA family dioxygenase [Saccharothrix ecbatanensis]MBB5803635.1 alpha-ketoglutarate-dependent taurine dioxygenase [Saccharothrix ecbatanensis]